MQKKPKNVNVNIQFVDNDYRIAECTEAYQQLFDVLSMIGKNISIPHLTEKTSVLC